MVLLRAVERRLFDEFFIGRSDWQRKWACRRAPTKEGALLERWRAQCGTARQLYSSPRVRVFPARDPPPRILDVSAFLSRLAATSAPGPHQSAFLEGPRKMSESLAMTPSGAARELLELIAALDRRVPHVERAGEASIARDAAALKARALKRIEELEREAAYADKK